MDADIKKLLKIPTFLKLGHPDNDAFIERGIAAMREKDPKYVPIIRKKKVQRKQLLID